METLSYFDFCVLAGAGAGLAVWANNKVETYLGPNDVKRLLRPAGYDWVHGHEKALRESVNSSFYLAAVEEVGHTVALSGPGLSSQTLLVADPEALRHIFVKYPSDYEPVPSSNAANRHHRFILHPSLAQSISYERLTTNEDHLWETLNTLTLRLQHEAAGSTATAMNILDWTDLASGSILSRLLLGPGAPSEASTVADLKKAVGQILNQQVKPKAEESAPRTWLDNPFATGCSAEQITQQVVDFILSTSQAISNTVALACLELARNPTFQNKLRMEILEAKLTSGHPTYQELESKLPFLDAVCRETLRMYPAVSHVERVCTREDTIPLRYSILTNDAEYIDAIRVRKGQVFRIPTVVLNRNRDMWGQHGYQFFPDRWTNPSMTPSSYLLTSGVDGTFTFAEGPAMCPGHRQVALALKMILFSLCRTFTFTEADEAVVTKDWPSLEPVVLGREHEGRQLPLRVRSVKA